MTLTVLVVAAVAGWRVWHSHHSEPPQIITLPNGERYRFAGATWSTKAVPPYWAAHVIRDIPEIVGRPLATHLGPRLTQMNRGETYPQPHLFVWFERLTTNSTGSFTPGTPTAVLADQSGVRAGAIGFPNLQSFVEWSFVSFQFVPRRSRTLECYFYASGYGARAKVPFGKVTFPNPAFGHFPQWQSEPLPNVQSTGDLEVRLDEVQSGVPVSGATVFRPNGSRAPLYAPIFGGPIIQTGFDFSLRSSHGTKETWLLHRANLSDSTGNLADRTSYESIGSWTRQPLSADWQPRSESLWGTLWPDEAAWRLKLDFKRGAGFSPADLVTFSNVPIPAIGMTNLSRLTNSLHDPPVILAFFMRRSNIPSNMLMDSVGNRLTELRFELPYKLGDLAVDFLKINTDAGEGTIDSHSDPYADRQYYSLWMRSIPTNATTATITLVVQKTLTVTFLVAPPRPKSPAQGVNP